ncbi:MAG: CPBP family intramembrane metalloprotease [Bacteroidetes bacterium]|nr:CPBP family intramembrane metalloprotease [Bacteroidota bacterium]
MIGIVIQLLLSWLLLWLIEKKSLSVLGFYPTGKRLRLFFLFLFITAAFSASEYLFRMWLAGQRWALNNEGSSAQLISGLWWNLKSVLFEELIFRGALFYILIKRIGIPYSLIISSSAFGIYHWFSHEVFGDPGQMLVTFIITGIMGLVYAYAYTKTFSLLVPIAIHFGWNMIKSVVFSDTVIGKQLLVIQEPVPVVTVSYFAYFFIGFFPIIGCWAMCFVLLKKQRQEPLP